MKEEGGGKGANAEAYHRALFIIEINGEGKALFGHIFAAGLPGFAVHRAHGIHHDELHLAAIFLKGRLKIRHFAAAGRAGAGPEVQHSGFPRLHQAGKRHLAAVRIVHRKIWRGLCRCRGGAAAGSALRAAQRAGKASLRRQQPIAYARQHQHNHQNQHQDDHFFLFHKHTFLSFMPKRQGNGLISPSSSKCPPQPETRRTPYSPRNSGLLPNPAHPSAFE